MEPIVKIYGDSTPPQQRKVGEILLEDFYGPNPTASLYDWCDKTRNRARKALAEGM